MTKQQTEQSRIVKRQERSINQGPTDVRGIKHISTLRNTSYKDYRKESGYQQVPIGIKNVDNDRIVSRVSTYQRNSQNKEERSFGGHIDQQGCSSQVEFAKSLSART